MKRALALLGLAACGAGNASGNPNYDGGTGADAPVGCQVTLSFTPSPPHSGATIRGVAGVTNPGGVSQFQWDIRFNNAPITPTQAASNWSQVDFFAASPGTYAINVMVTGGNYCEPALTYLDVLAPGANVVDYRLHVQPPQALAPPQDTIIEIDGGADSYRPVSLDPGITPSVLLTDGTNPVPAYARFLSATSPTAYVELYSSDGVLQPRLLGQPYSVLVVPASPNSAPALLSWTAGMPQLVVPAGSLVTGTVKDASGALLPGATVQLSSGGVPSTIATTAANGSYSLRATFPVGAMVTVDVTPPAGRALPRLTATAAFDLSKSVDVTYAPALATTCDLAGTPVQRASANQPGAKVTIVAPIASAGGVTAGAIVASATGVLRVGATADGTGKLPATLVPRSSGLSAVVELSATDRAVSAVDASACSVASIDAPAGTTAVGGVLDSTAAALPGVRVQAQPTRALALAGIPATEAFTDSTGHFSLPLATGGYYDVRFADPLGRAASDVVPDVAAAAIPTSQNLPKALHLSGAVSVVGSSNPVGGAALQILCATCSGLAASQPIAEAATDDTSRFVLAVPDPGTM
ncbi:MAG: carboxypeptidase-like regulatory domain-containing protein [Acidobacteriota bacterium]